MANTITVTKIVDGPRNLALHVYLKSDGASGDLVDEVIIDPIALGLTKDARLTIQSIESALSGFTGLLEFDTGLVDDKMVWVLSEHIGSSSFGLIGGLRDRSGVDGTGRLQLTTTGFTDVGDQGSIVITLTK